MKHTAGSNLASRSGRRNALRSRLHISSEQQDVALCGVALASKQNHAILQCVRRVCQRCEAPLQERRERDAETHDRARRIAEIGDGFRLTKRFENMGKWRMEFRDADRIRAINVPGSMSRDAAHQWAALFMREKSRKKAWTRTAKTARSKTA